LADFSRSEAQIPELLYLGSSSFRPRVTGHEPRATARSNAHIGKKLSKIFDNFCPFFSFFRTFFAIFSTFSHFLALLNHELARLVRKSALLIEILTHLRINLRVWCYSTFSCKIENLNSQISNKMLTCFSLILVKY
jgi:hypothetical protein